MKRLMILLFFITMGLTISTKAEPGFGRGGFEMFYSSLSPYGTWIQIDGGLNVWRPFHLNRGWVPYKYGRWIWTDDGWYWQSDEPFGYIVFHYGRWYYDDYYGWIWVPDDVWAPAWVEWRYDNDYIGWAPLPPYASFSIGIGIRFTTGYATPYRYWHFVKYRYMCDPYVYKYYIPERYKYRIYSGSRYRTNYGYSDGRVINRGVDVDFVRKRSGARIVERNIERVDNARDMHDRGDRNSGNVRAYIINRDKIQVNNDRNFEVRRGERASSLELNRVEIGRSEQFKNSTPRVNDMNNGRNSQARPEPGVNNRNNRIENPDIRNRENRSERKIIQGEVKKQNEARPRSEERTIRREQKNENKYVRPEVKKQNTERKAPENRRDSRNNRNDRNESNPNRRR